MPRSLEDATRQFYRWERLGHGSRQWSYPVSLEPRFEPFLGHVRLRVLPNDDGRHPSVFERIGTFLNPPTKVVTEEPEEEEELQPESDEPDEFVTEFSMALPEGTRVDQDAVKGFFLALASVRSPVAFELIGSGARVRLQWAVDQGDAEMVGELLRSFFPAAAILETRASFAEEWLRLPGYLSAAELGLAREFMLPLRTVSRADPDPLTALIAVLGNAERDDIAAFQVLFAPARGRWNDSVRRAVTDPEGEPFFLDAPDFTTLALEKFSGTLFATVVRIAACSRDPGRSHELLRHLAGALCHFERADGNEFLPLQNEYDIDLEADMLLRQSHRTGMLLSLDELAGIAHPPSASVTTPKLVRRMARTKAAPFMSLGHALILGTNEHASQVREVTLSPDLRMRHLHVIGASGTGKSTFLLDLICQSAELGEGVALLDPHGDLVDEVLARIPERRYEDVVLVDASDAEHPVGFNILAGHSDLERQLLASDLVGIFRRLSTSWGDQMNSVFANAIQAFLTSSVGGSIADLRRFLIEQDYRREFLATVEDEEVVYYWTREFPLLVGKPAAPILTRLDTFLRPKPLRAMLTQRESRLDFREIMDEGRIMLVKLAQGAIGEENAALLGSLMVAKFHQAALSRQDIAPEKRRDFHLVIDEFQEVMTPSLAGILSGTRKFRLGLTCAHQNLRTIYDADSVVASSLLANAATRVVFRVGDDDAKKLADGFAAFDAHALTSLGVGEAICRIDGADHDFNLKTRMAKAVIPEEAADRRTGLVERSRAKYARTVSPVGNNIGVGVSARSIPTNEQPPAKLSQARPTKARDLLRAIQDKDEPRRE